MTRRPRSIAMILSPGHCQRVVVRCSVWLCTFVALGLVMLVVLAPDARAAQVNEDPVDRGQDTSAADPVAALANFLQSHPAENTERLAQAAFAQMPLDREQAMAAGKMLRAALLENLKEQRREEFQAQRVVAGKSEMKFFAKVYGEAPPNGRRLFLSMHGGGGAPRSVNDQQWENQKRLYQPAEGVYVAPRAPIDAWNMWHVVEVDALLIRLIEAMILFENVDPDRVYLMGYSAGGDGVYQIAPRMADRFAAAAMMAGHPNESTPDGLRNLPFCLQMGGKDAAYDRNKIAARWETELGELQKTDPSGYPHRVKIYPDFGHWMNGEDAMAVPWMSEKKRVAFPERIVWKQDDVTHRRFYWLGNGDAEIQSQAKIVASFQGQNVQIEAATAVQKIDLYLNDHWIDLDQPIQVLGPEKQVLFAGKVKRTIQSIAATTEVDEARSASAKISVEL